MSTAGSRPRISVIMPVRDREEYVEAAVSSVLAQSHPDLELIVVDDHSTDATITRVRQVADDRVLVVPSAGHGVAAARNTGLDVARGDLITWQDSDDLSMPHRLKALTDALTPGAGYVHSDMLIIDGAGRPLGYSQSSALPQSRVLHFLLRSGTPFNNPTMLVRHELVEGIRFDEALTIGEDTDFIRRYAPHVPGVHVPEPLVMYRRHATNVTKGLSIDMVRPEIQRLLSDERLEDLVPEAFRAYSDPAAAESIACAIVAHTLMRRGLPDEAVHWFGRAADAGPGEDAGSVVSAVLHMATGERRQAAEKAASAGRTSITCVLLAELAGLDGRLTEAAELYREALAADPEHCEAVVGLRATGGAVGLALIDDNWRRFASFR